MNKDFFIETFIECLGYPDDFGLLEQYIDFVLNYDTIIRSKGITVSQGTKFKDLIILFETKVL